MPFRKQKFANRGLAFVFGGLSVASTSLLMGIITIVQQKFPGEFTLTSNPNMQASWWSDKHDNYIEHCHVKHKFSDSLLNQCLGQEARSSGQPIGYLIGDSNARNYLIAAKKAFPRMKVKYLTMGHGCAFLPDNMISKKIDDNVDCVMYSRTTAKYILTAAKPGDIVFIGQSLAGSRHGARAVPAYFDHIKAMASSLHQKHIPIVLFDGTYPVSQLPELCSKEVWRPFPDPAGCQKTAEEAKQAYSKFDHMAEHLAANTKNVFYAPLRLGLCFDGICGQNSKLGTPIWHDSTHISETASGELHTLLRSELTADGLLTYIDAGKRLR
jgi:hypothetical protein